MNIISNPHDALFKEVFGKIDVAKDFINTSIPENILNNLDLESLEKDNSSYITDELKESFSDIVYNCYYKGKKSRIPLMIAFILDHKSFKPQYPHVKTLLYLANYYYDCEKRKDELRVAIPVFVYHGKDKWDIIPFYEYFEGIDENLMPFIPNFSYLLKDLNKIDDKEILDRYKEVILKIITLLFKYVFKDEFDERLDSILKLGKQLYESDEGISFLKSLFIYLISIKRFEKTKIVETFDNLYRSGGDMATTLMEELLEEGRNQAMATINKLIEKDREKEKVTTAQKMKAKGINIPDISSITGLPVEMVENL